MSVVILHPFTWLEHIYIALMTPLLHQSQGINYGCPCHKTGSSKEVHMMALACTNVKLDLLTIEVLSSADTCNSNDLN